MHGYGTSHGGDLNENDNFDVWKLIIHGYKHLHWDDLHENENCKIEFKKYCLVDLLGWKHSRIFAKITI